MLFEILPLMVYQMAGPRLTELPVELMAVILRYLDPETLLNVVKAYKRCMEVTLGDPILRRRLKMLIKEKKKLEVERIINPALSVTVTRTEPSRMFNTNVIKTVKKKAVPKPDCFVDGVMDLLKRKKKDLELGNLKTSNKYSSCRL